MPEVLDPRHVYVTVDLMILTVREKDLCLMLGRRENPPYALRLALPGRFIGLQENAEVTARRLLDEMLPAQEPFLEQLYTFSEVSRDPRGRVISCAYLAVLPWKQVEALLTRPDVPLRPYRVSVDASGGLLLTGDGEARVTEGDLAFDHGRIIRTGISRLRGKIDYTDIAFHFLEDPRAFPLGALQTVFEAVLGTPLDSSNFRRGLFSRYERSGALRKTYAEVRKGKGRPAVLYRYDFK